MKIKKSGFTLIEMLIVMTIFFILVIMTYVNYAYFQNIARVKLGLKEISQSISSARNMAIAGYTKGGINQSIGIYFDKSNNNILKFYSYNYSSGTNIVLDNSYLLKEKKLQDNVGIQHLSGQENMMIFFSSIYGTGSMFYFDDSGVKQDFLDNILDIDIAFKNATNFPLKRELKYVKYTNTTDY